ncbi:N-acetylglucosaminyl deacetylase, LmbE family [Actinopolyspora xinjiangensis]|uniref:N-acetylglucosaminyl deacetylase, LmbE family n=1 Tax=Actinopolyspora xinjiangensis TaxID=405564 RepID=A0A1H0RVM6_9ACTN|nr:PIG-L family deacetylase [Actinopolyspora xinjiangensis]SDP33440.1 N-acetylglucosaminyl deacetylase, LmbE family [Actinopolyspora xinjiangensis]
MVEHPGDVERPTSDEQLPERESARQPGWHPVGVESSRQAHTEDVETPDSATARPHEIIFAPAPGEETPTAPDSALDQGETPLVGLRIVVADHDVGLRRRTAELLREYGAREVVEAGDREKFRTVLRTRPRAESRWHVALWDRELEPDPEGLAEFLNTCRHEFPGTAFVLTTDEISTTSAVSALRGRASEIVTRQASGAELAETVLRALRDRQQDHEETRGGREPFRMLVVGAHPDDAEIGAGGTIHRRVRAGWEVTVLTMSHGAVGGDPDERVREAHAAINSLGATLLLEDLPDGAILDDVETVRRIERAVRRVQPDVVLVHSENDTHQDHRAVYRATVSAARGVERFACYQSPSATVEFAPNRFAGLREEDLEAKLASIHTHGSQASRRAYPREDLLRATARYWSRFTREHYAEPLELLRVSGAS